MRYPKKIYDSFDIETYMYDKIAKTPITKFKELDAKYDLVIRYLYNTINS
jgi:hypothetical protein